ncbi:MAG TPA: DUF3231 domain-containing protein [Desulfotomaculum sp.]|nr:MAG: hypothetical protein JL56_11895 [Desulfotomaculum sp. BICA1-6]HBX23555.1 DUF3231 domain-containing protein [Desulfotomaculum sp.]
MVLEIIRNKIQKQELRQIDAQEAFNLWDILNSKYHEIERLLILEHFVHDIDLKLLIRYFVGELNENVAILKKEMNKYKVTAPAPNRIIGPPPCNIEMYTDEFIAGEMLLYIQEHIENLLRTLRNSMTNDSIRTVISKMTKDSIDNETKIVNYMTLKGWIKKCPHYNSVPASVDEKISAAEAYHLWDHLCFRYDNIQQTRFYLAYVHDIDFRVVLEQGLRKLTLQTEMLEKEIQHFGIVAPKKPTDVIISTGRMDFMEDDYMYRMILIGLQGASMIHTQSLKQCTYNMRIKNIFKKLLKEEIDILGRYVKFGKLKGWLYPGPAFTT